MVITSRLVHTLLLLLVLARATAAALSPRDAHAHRLLQQDRDTLAEELRQWKQSPLAREAQQLGVLTSQPPSSKPKSSIASTVATTDDELWRFALSKATVAELQRVHPLATFSTRTPFALLTTSEFQQFVGRSGIASLNPHVRPTANTNTTMSNSTTASTTTRRQSQRHRRLADAFDWSDMGCVARVKNQGACGACAYFAAAAALEAAQCIFEGGGVAELSEQYLLSCFPYGYGCAGAWPGRIIEWAHTEGGVCASDAAPYTAGESAVTGECAALHCEATRARAAATVEVAQSDDALVDAIATQPVAVTLSGGSAAFQYYAGGVLEDCGPEAITDHAVLAVGYGHSNELGAYFRLKNSWGEWWGEQGFMKLRRNANANALSAPDLGACRILEVAPTYPAFY